MTTTIRLVRDTNEYRLVSVEKDGSYRIWGMNGTIGKKHTDFSQYYQHCIDNGWHKASLSEYLTAKYRYSEEGV